MNLNNSQNFVQPSGSAGSGALGAIVGAFGQAAAFKRQLNFATYQNHLAQQRDLFRIVAKNHVETEGIKGRQDAEMESYINAHTKGIDAEKDPEGHAAARKTGIDLYRKHLDESGMKGGSLSWQRKQVSLQSDINAAKDRANAERLKGESTRTENQFDEVTPAPSGSRQDKPANENPFANTLNESNIFSQTGRGTVSKPEGTGLLQAGRNGSVAAFNKVESNVPGRAAWDSGWNSNLEKDKSSKLSNINAENSAMDYHYAKDPDPFDVAQAHVGGKITDSEANSLSGTNRFNTNTSGDSDGNYSMSTEDVHGSNRNDEFNAGGNN
jgi:hypothetical protein